MKDILLTMFLSVGGMGAVVMILAGLIPAKKLSYMGKGLGMFLVDTAYKKFGAGVVKPIRIYIQNSVIAFVIGYDNIEKVRGLVTGGLIGGLGYKNNLPKQLNELSPESKAGEERLRAAEERVKKELKK